MEQEGRESRRKEKRKMVDVGPPDVETRDDLRFKIILEMERKSCELDDVATEQCSIRNYRGFCATMEEDPEVAKMVADDVHIFLDLVLWSVLFIYEWMV